MLVWTLAVLTTMRPMYYKVEGTEFERPDWPAAYLKYEILIANPGFSNATLAKIRSDLPGAKLVAYTCFAWAYVTAPCTNCTGSKCSGCPSSRCVDRLDAQGQPYWNANWTVRNLNDNRPICPFGGTHHEVVPVAAWIPSEASVAAMVRFHAEHTVVGYDGIYVDDFHSSFYAPWATYTEVISAPPEHTERCSHEPVHGTASRPPNCSSHFAVGAAGHNATLAALQAQYAAWRPYYSRELRTMLGPERLLIANVNSPHAADPSLDGVTVEFEHCAGDQSPHLQAAVEAREGAASAAAATEQALSDECMSILQGQHALSALAGRAQSAFALWLTHGEVAPILGRCAR